MGRSNEIEVKTFVKRHNRMIPKVNPNETYVSAKEYASIMGLHKVTVLRYLENSRIEEAIKVGGRWRIPVNKF